MSRLVPPYLAAGHGSPLLGRSLAMFLKIFPVLPWTQLALFRSYDSGLVLPLAWGFSPPSHWEPSSIFHRPSVSYIYSGFPARRLFCLPPAYLLKLFLRPWRWRRYVPTSVATNRLHGVTSQKMILFITTAVKTSNPKHKASSHCTPMKACENVKLCTLLTLEIDGADSYKHSCQRKTPW
jgi:hypothetical protein